MGDRLSVLLVSLIALRLVLVDRNPFQPCFFKNYTWSTCFNIFIYKSNLSIFTSQCLNLGLFEYKILFTQVVSALMPLFHQRIKPRSCLGPLIVGSLGKNGKKIDQWGGRQNRYEGLGLTTDRPQDAPGGPRQSLTGLGLRTD